MRKIVVLILIVLCGCASLETGEPFRPAAETAPIEVLTLRSIYFEEGAHSLSHDAKLLLDQHAAWLACHPFAQLVVKGHCDYVGEQDDKMELSRRRAVTAAAYLHSAGAKNTILERWFGSSLPMDTVSSPAAHARNRRVEFVILPGTEGVSTCIDAVEQQEHR